MMITSLSRIFAFVFVAATASRAAESSHLNVQDALGVLAFANRMPIALSPDGGWVAYTVEDSRKRESTNDERYMYYTKTGAFTEAIGCDVWITNMKSGEARNLTEGKGASSSPVWSPDGKYLAFYSDRSGTERLWLWERANGKIRQISDAIIRPFFNFQVVRWTPDSRFVLAKILPDGISVEQAADLFSPTAQAASAGQSKVAGATVKVFSSDPAPDKNSTAAAKPVKNESWMNRYLGDLALIEVATGKVDRIAAKIRPLGYWISPDAKSIAYTDWQGIEENTQQPVYSLNVYSIADRQSRALVQKIPMDYGISVSWSPDSQALAYFSSKGDCFRVRTSGGEAQNLTPGTHPPFHNDHRAPLWDEKGESVYLINTETYGRLGDNQIWAASIDGHSFRKVAEIRDRTILEIAGPAGGGRFWSPEGGSMIVAARDGVTKRTGFYRVSLADGKVSALFEEPRHLSGDCIFFMDTSRDRKQIAFVSQDAQHPEDIWIASADFKDRRRLTHINPQIENLNFGKSRIVDWRGIDGQPLHGALLLPAGYEEGKRYPLVVNVYGGSYRSNGVYRFGLSGGGVENLQILATRGYAVLLPDTPLRPGSPMHDLLKTVIPGVDRVIDLGIADPDRLGVMGHSYGGYSTLSLIVQTTRFKAAVDSAGPANLISAYGEMDKSGSSGTIGWAETGQGGMVGTPWQFRDRYIENSPIFFLDRVETPLLIVQGELDRTVPPTQAEEVFVGLRRLGKKVTYAKYAGEEHWEGTWSPANVEDYWNRVIGWFDEHLK